jgi:hypothetical protein
MIAMAMGDQNGGGGGQAFIEGGAADGIDIDDLIAKGEQEAGMVYRVDEQITRAGLDSVPVHACSIILRKSRIHAPRHKRQYCHAGNQITTLHFELHPAVAFKAT